jgi:hypothetical protein
VRFVVENPGPGIAPGDIRLLFRRFQQLDGSDGRQRGGDGAGARDLEGDRGAAWRADRGRVGAWAENDVLVRASGGGAEECTVDAVWRRHGYLNGRLMALYWRVIPARYEGDLRRSRTASAASCHRRRWGRSRTARAAAAMPCGRSRVSRGPSRCSAPSPACR